MSDSEASGLGDAFASTEPSQSGPEVFLVNIYKQKYISSYASSSANRPIHQC